MRDLLRGGRTLRLMALTLSLGANVIPAFASELPEICAHTLLKASQGTYVVISPNGENYVSYGPSLRQKTMPVFSLGSPSPIGNVVEPRLPILKVGWAGPNTLIADTGNWNSYSIWSVPFGVKLGSFGTLEPAPLAGSTFAVSRDGKLTLRIQKYDGDFRLVVSDVSTGAVVATHIFTLGSQPAHDSPVAHFAADGKSILLIPGQGANPRVLRFGRSRKLIPDWELALARDDGHPGRIDWNTAAHELGVLEPWENVPEQGLAWLHSLEARSYEGGVSSLSSTGTAIAIVTRAGSGTTLRSSIEVWDAENKKITKTILMPHCGVDGTIFSPDGRYLAIVTTSYIYGPTGEAASKSGFVMLWDTKIQRFVARLTSHQGDPTGGGFSSDGKTFFLSTKDGFVRRWALAPAT